MKYIEFETHKGLSILGVECIEVDRKSSNSEEHYAVIKCLSSEEKDRVKIIQGVYIDRFLYKFRNFDVVDITNYLE